MALGNIINQTSSLLEEIKPTMNENDVTLSNKHVHRQHNVYNIFYMLERQRLIQELNEMCEISAANQNQQQSNDRAGYDLHGLPDLPSRYQHVHMPQGWYVPGKNSKRKHVKSHGCESLILMTLLLVLCWMNVTI